MAIATTADTTRIFFDRTAFLATMRIGTLEGTHGATAMTDTTATLIAEFRAAAEEIDRKVPGSSRSRTGRPTPMPSPNLSSAP